MMICALIAVVMYAIALTLFVRLQMTGAYSLVAQAVSDYGVGQTKRLFATYGLAGTAAALALAGAVALSPDLPRRVAVYLGLMVITRLGVLAFPTDLQGHDTTRNGRLHYLFAIVSFALTYMAIDAAGPAVAGMAGGWAPLFAGLGWIVTISLAGVVIAMLTPLRRVFGLVERLFLLSSLLWLMALALLLATR